MISPCYANGSLMNNIPEKSSVDIIKKPYNKELILKKTKILNWDTLINNGFTVVISSA